MSPLNIFGRVLSLGISRTQKTSSTLHRDDPMNLKPNFQVKVRFLDLQSLCCIWLRGDIIIAFKPPRGLSGQPASLSIADKTHLCETVSLSHQGSEPWRISGWYYSSSEYFRQETNCYKKWFLFSAMKHLRPAWTRHNLRCFPTSSRINFSPPPLYFCKIRLPAFFSLSVRPFFYLYFLINFKWYLSFVASFFHLACVMHFPPADHPFSISCPQSDPKKTSDFNAKTRERKLCSLSAVGSWSTALRETGLLFLV